MPMGIDILRKVSIEVFFSTAAYDRLIVERFLFKISSR
jgi:hypothetical protein